LLVLLDTSILIYLVETPSSFLEGLTGSLGKVEFAVTDSVLGELKGLAASRGARAKKAKGALSYAQGLKSYPVGGEADDSLVKLALRERAVVATLDGELASSLRRKGIPVATLSGDRLLVLGATT